MTMKRSVHKQHFFPHSQFDCNVCRAGLFAMLGDGIVSACDYQCHNGSIHQVRDNLCRCELNNFHSDMLHHVSVGPTASCWERCWSSLHIHGFLLTRIQRRSQCLKRNMMTVLQPLHSIANMNRKAFSPSPCDI